MTESKPTQKFIDLQIGGEIKSPELLRDLVENIRAALFVREPAFEGVEGLKVLAQQINADAGYGSSIHIQTTISEDSLLSPTHTLDASGSRIEHTALRELHASCVMGNLAYVILEANEGQEGYNTLYSWEPGPVWDDKQQAVDFVGDMIPAISLPDLQKAEKEGMTLGSLIAKLAITSTATARHQRIEMDQSVYEELVETLDAETSAEPKI